nr:MAG TPA: hypothetical protein [Caudoviricetes sp.]
MEFFNIVTTIFLRSGRWLPFIINKECRIAYIAFLHSIYPTPYYILRCQSTISM